jgi:glycerol-3-phosphate acyltransferase PlsY
VEASLVQLLLALTVGYALGSIPFGLVLTRFAGLGDLRAIGSGNIGATNVLRTGNKGLAGLTLLADALKGTVAVVVASAFFPWPAPLAAAAGAFLGHIAPVWLGFRGGKGVATFLGVLLALDWRAALAFAVVWVVVAAATRYSSLAALVASCMAPVVFWAAGRGDAALIAALLVVVLWLKHRANIERLLARREGRIGQAS